MSQKFDLLLKNLPKNIAQLVDKQSIFLKKEIEEIRLKALKPLMIYTQKGGFFVSDTGEIEELLKRPYIVTKNDISSCFELICQSSVYSVAEEIKNGFITIEGGHRVGICGKAVILDEKIKAIKDIASINIRVSKEIIGASDKVMQYIFENDKINNTLIISPPKCGKTTLLRDIARQLSNGNEKYNLKGFKVCIIDERSEIASCYNGIPQNDVGIRTDVLDGCPKHIGMQIVLRSMSPDVIITDEIGTCEDALAINKILNCGVNIITSIHGYSIQDIEKRADIGKLILNKAFNKIIVLGNKNGTGTIEEIFNNN